MGCRRIASRHGGSGVWSRGTRRFLSVKPTEPRDRANVDTQTAEPERFRGSTMEEAKGGRDAQPRLVVSSAVRAGAAATSVFSKGALIRYSRACLCLSSSTGVDCSEKIFYSIYRRWKEVRIRVSK